MITHTIPSKQAECAERMGITDVFQKLIGIKALNSNHDIKNDIELAVYGLNESVYYEFSENDKYEFSFDCDEFSKNKYNEYETVSSVKKYVIYSFTFTIRSFLIDEEIVIQYETIY